MIRLKSVLHLLAGAIALLGYLSLAPYLDALPLLVFPLLLVAAAIAKLRGPQALPTWAINLGALAVFAFYLPQLSRTHLVPAISILCLLLGLRLLAAQDPRHLLQVYALALFALAGSTLFDLSPRFLVYLALLFFAVALSLVLLTFTRSEPELRLSSRQLRGLLGTGLVMPALALPLAALLFVVLPRTQVPMWDFLNARGESKTGYTDRVQPGAADAISSDNALVLRAQTQELPMEDLYWRGTVLNQMEGQAWVRRTPPHSAPEQPAQGRRIAQQIFPEPGPQQVLFALDSPLQIEGLRFEVSSDRVFSARRRDSQRISYQATSLLGRSQSSAASIPRTFYLQLPEDLSPALRSLAAEIYGNARTDEERLARLRRFFAEGNFRYSTSNLPTGDDSLLRFLTEERAGHCEFFASSFAVLLRLGGIPARLVGGYYGGDYNAIGGYYLIRENRAHAWVEVWREHVGWERIDPSIYAVNYENALRPALTGGWRLSLRMAVDTLNHFWSSSLLNFDVAQQMQVLHSARQSLQALSLDRQKWSAVAMLLTVGISLVAAGWWWRRRQGQAREDHLLRRFLAHARRRLGLRRLPDHLGLFEIAARLGDAESRRFVAIYGAALYGERPLTRAQRKALQRLLKQMKKPRGEQEPLSETPGDRTDRPR